MEILFALFMGFFGGTVAFNYENCIADKISEPNVQISTTMTREEYCEALASNDMQAENFEWIRTASWGVIN